MTARSADIGFFKGIGESSGSKKVCTSGATKLKVTASKYPRATRSFFTIRSARRVSGTPTGIRLAVMGCAGMASKPMMRASSSMRSTSRPISKRQLGAVHNQPCSCPTTQKPRPSRMRSTSTRSTLMPSSFSICASLKRTASFTGRSASETTSVTGPASPPAASINNCVTRSIASRCS